MLDNYKPFSLININTCFKLIFKKCSLNTYKYMITYKLSCGIPSLKLSMACVSFRYLLFKETEYPIKYVLNINWKFRGRCFWDLLVHQFKHVELPNSLFYNSLDFHHHEIITATSSILYSQTVTKGNKFTSSRTSCKFHFI